MLTPFWAALSRAFILNPYSRMQQQDSEQLENGTYGVDRNHHHVVLEKNITCHVHCLLPTARTLQKVGFCSSNRRCKSRGGIVVNIVIVLQLTISLLPF